MLKLTPLVFLGSKTRAQYSWDRTSITKKEAYDFLPYAAAAATAHEVGACSKNALSWSAPLGYDVINPINLKFKISEIKKERYCLFDPRTTLKIVLLVNRDEKKLFITFGAKNSFETETTDNEQKKLWKREQNYQIFQNFVGFKRL